MKHTRQGLAQVSSTMIVRCDSGAAGRHTRRSAPPRGTRLLATPRRGGALPCAAASAGCDAPWLRFRRPNISKISFLARNKTRVRGVVSLHPRGGSRCPAGVPTPRCLRLVARDCFEAGLALSAGPPALSAGPLMAVDTVLSVAGASLAPFPDGHEVARTAQFETAEVASSSS